MAVEREAKIKVSDLEAIQNRLRENGGIDKGEVLERNWVLDRHDGSLQTEDVLLRIRNNGGKGGVLTVKCRLDEEGEFKCRQELETEVDSTEELLRQLKMIGFGIKWIYEKRRATWHFGNCVIALDILPELGSFVEIEGEADCIRNVAQTLGLDPNDHLNENYLALWENHLCKCGDEKRHMVFPKETSRTSVPCSCKKDGIYDNRK